MQLGTLATLQQWMHHFLDELQLSPNLDITSARWADFAASIKLSSEGVGLEHCISKMTFKF